MNIKKFTLTTLILLVFASSSNAITSKNNTKKWVQNKKGSSEIIGSSVLLLSDGNINTKVLESDLSDIQPDRFDTKQPQNLIQKNSQVFIADSMPKGEVSYQWKFK